MVACILILVKLLTTPLLVSTYLFRISEEVQLFSSSGKTFTPHFNRCGERQTTMEPQQPVTNTPGCSGCLDYN